MAHPENSLLEIFVAFESRIQPRKHSGLPQAVNDAAPLALNTNRLPQPPYNFATPVKHTRQDPYATKQGSSGLEPPLLEAVSNLPAAGSERKLDDMSQISPVPGQKTKIAVIVFCALALAALFIMWKHEGDVAQQQELRPSAQPQQSPQPQQSQGPLSSQRLQQAQEQQQSQETRQSTQPQQLQQPPQSEEPRQSPESQEPHARTIADAAAVGALLQDYRNRNGVYPTTLEGLEALGIPRKKDPWGNDYIYQSPSSRGREAYDFFSPGPDHMPDTADDDWGGTEDPNE